MPRPCQCLPLTSADPRAFLPRWRLWNTGPRTGASSATPARRAQMPTLSVSDYPGGGMSGDHFGDTGQNHPTAGILKQLMEAIRHSIPFSLAQSAPQFAAQGQTTNGINVNDENLLEYVLRELDVFQVCVGRATGAIGSESAPTQQGPACRIAFLAYAASQIILHPD